MQAFFKKLQALLICSCIEDKMVYVKSLYSSIENSEAFPTSLVWNPWVPVRVSFFTWELLWGRILTLEQLKRRWWRIPYRCYMCKGDEETANHSLLHYWKQPCYGFLFILLLRIGWVMHFFVREVLLMILVSRRRGWRHRDLPPCVSFG